MEYAGKLRYASTLKDWVLDAGWPNAYAVTLTLKQNVRRDDGTRAYVTQDEAAKAVGVFIKKLNQCCFSKGDLRRGKKLKTVAVFEGDKKFGQRLHCHLLISMPPGMGEDCTDKLINTLWRRLTWGYTETRVRKCYNTGGWIKYIFKVSSKSVFDLCFAYDLWNID